MSQAQEVTCQKKRPERLVLNKEGIVNSPTVVCISSLLPSVNVKSTIFSYADTKPSALNIDNFKQNLNKIKFKTSAHGMYVEKNKENKDDIVKKLHKLLKRVKEIIKSLPKNETIRHQLN